MEKLSATFVFYSPALPKNWLFQTLRLFFPVLFLQCLVFEREAESDSLLCKLVFFIYIYIFQVQIKQS